MTNLESLAKGRKYINDNREGLERTKRERKQIATELLMQNPPWSCQRVRDECVKRTGYTISGSTISLIRHAIGLNMKRTAAQPVIARDDSVKNKGTGERHLPGLTPVLRELRELMKISGVQSILIEDTGRVELQRSSSISFEL